MLFEKNMLKNLFLDHAQAAVSDQWGLIAYSGKIRVSVTQVSNKMQFHEFEVSIIMTDRNVEASLELTRGLDSKLPAAKFEFQSKELANKSDKPETTKTGVTTKVP